jgi:hypothetical protein
VSNLTKEEVGMNSYLRVFLAVVAVALLVCLGSGCTATKGGTKEGVSPPPQVVAPMPTAKQYVYPTYSTNCGVGVNGGRIPGARIVSGDMRGRTISTQVGDQITIKDEWTAEVTCARR